MRKTFELSAETAAIIDVFHTMSMGQQMTFRDLSRAVKFIVSSSSGAYYSARRIAERDHGVYIGGNRGVGFFRGSGEDMADSLEPLAARMRRAAKRSISRADLAISNNLTDEKYKRTMERRNRASIIFSTSGSLPAASNRRRSEPAPEAAEVKPFEALRSAK